MVGSDYYNGISKHVVRKVLQTNTLLRDDLQREFDRSKPKSSIWK